MSSAARSEHRRALGIWALGLLVLAPVAALLAWHHFDGLYGQDAFAYEAYAVGPAREALLRFDLLGLPAMAFPPGFPILAAVVSLVVGPTALAGALVALGAGAVVPVATALLARELAARRTDAAQPAWLPVLAGAIVGLTAHLWQSSAVVMSDTTGLAFATLGAWALVRYGRGADWRWLVLSGAALAIAVETRWAYGLVALPLGALALWIAVARRSGRGPVLASVGALAAAAGVAAIVLAPMLVPLGTALIARHPVPFVAQLETHGWDPGNILRSAVNGPDGHQVYPLPMGIFYLLQPAQPYYLTPVFAGLALVGAAAVARRRDVLEWAILLAWPALTLVFLAGGTTQNTRFTLAALPPLAILAARGMTPTIERLAASGIVRRRAAGVAARVVGGVALATLLAMAAIAARFTDGFIVRWQADRAAISALAAEVPAEARLLSFGSTATLRWLGRDAVDLFDLQPPEVLALAADGRPTFVMIPSAGLEAQWAALPPGRDLEALRAGPGLESVDATASWSLFRVR
jgi:4-amino-4-deoxy-L-arabinose transferase-like glycosyltransferase